MLIYSTFKTGDTHFGKLVGKFQDQLKTNSNLPINIFAINLTFNLKKMTNAAFMFENG